MTKKSREKHFSEEQIKKYRNDPNVRYVDDHTIRFTYEFRLKLYEVWEKEKRQGIRKTLTENGYDLKELGDALISTISNTFKDHGRPSNVKRNHSVGSSIYRINPEDNDYLLSTRKFVKGRNGRGITFSDAFRNELFLAYPAQSVEEGLCRAGIDPDKVGYRRIYLLQKEFEGVKPSSREAHYSAEIINKYKSHPYIRSITPKQLKFTKPFFNEASFLIEIMKVDEILKLYEIAPDDISVSSKVNLKYRLAHWKRTDDQCRETSEQLVRIQYHRYQKLTELVEERFKRIREEELPSLNYLQKKKLCYWIKGYPIDPMKVVNTSLLLKRVGISRSSYYSILRNDKYGTALLRQEKQDEEDAELVRQVMEYRGYRKGIRQICMMMPDVTARKFSLKKIRRLMKKYGITSGIREKKQSRIEMRKLLEEHKKPNVLQRRFRIAGPNTNILTDVTYIPYGDKKMAYGSACIDAVTGRLYNLTISDCNDMKLVSSTADSLKDVTFAPGAVFHSDQGTLYLTDTFQKKIEDLGLIQSMSKRGNCWDNAPQESFFGHFKDEFDYKNCNDLNELKVGCEYYADYYNNERRQWERNRMTPMEYEKHLKEMDEEEFSRYLKKETEKYERMKKRAAEQAHEKAKTLGV